jgi:UDP-N-acetylmuramoyl-tripeptide--D-alanyl-D-alanine ligase
MIRSLTLDAVVEVTGGALVDGPNIAPGMSGEEVVTSVSTDTRSIQPGSLFVALRGENHDAHNYLLNAREKGAAAFVVDRALSLTEAQVPHVVVVDTTHALGDIARFVRDAFTGPVVGVTGSVGKTTVKEMIAHVLTANYKVLKSEANHNNEFGVPQTIFNLDESHTALVVEMGMRGAGQILRLAEIAAPTIGVVTGIGVSHVELLGSREEIAKAKGELFELLPAADGLAIYPATDEFAEELKARVKGKMLSVAIDAPADVQATELSRHENGWRFTVNTPWGTTKMFVPSPGRFNVQNALFAVAVAGSLEIPLDAIARALMNWAPPAMRMETLQSEKGFTILSDAYNAAPDSMVGALETLKSTPVGPNGKRIAVLGEMRELGKYAEEAHKLVGRAAALYPPDTLILVGELTKKMAVGALADGFPLDHLHQLDTTDEAVSLVPFIVQPGDAVLVKGSRALALERVVAALGPKESPAEEPTP